MIKIAINTIEDFDKLRKLKDTECIATLNYDLDFDDFSSYKNVSNCVQDSQNNFKPINLRNTNLIFDGGNNRISNMRIHLPLENNVGMFNTLDGSIILIKNLIVDNSWVCGKNNVGTLGGVFNGTLNNTEIFGTLLGNKTVGGVAGISDKKIVISDCKINVEVMANDIYGIVAGSANELVINKSKLESASENNINLARIYKKIDITTKQRKRTY